MKGLLQPSTGVVRALGWVRWQILCETLIFRIKFEILSFRTQLRVIFTPWGYEHQETVLVVITRKVLLTRRGHNAAKHVAVNRAATPTGTVLPQTPMVLRLRDPGLDIGGEESMIIPRFGPSAVNGVHRYLFCDDKGGRRDNFASCTMNEHPVGDCKYFTVFAMVLDSSSFL